MSVTCIIVNYRTRELLPPLLGDLLREERVARIVVVDNSGELEGRVPGPAFQRTPSKKIRIISPKENLGFGSAVNRALPYCLSQWILVINPDMRMVPGSLAALVEGATRFGAELCGPRFYWDDALTFRLPPATGGSMWTDFGGMCAARFPMDRELFSFHWIMRHDRFWGAKQPFFEPFLSGACLLVSRRWVEKGGGDLFDERFFLYFEDSDLCARAMEQGVRPLVIPDARVVHYYDQAPHPEAGKPALMEQAHRKMMEKHYGEGAPVPPGEDAPFTDVVDLGELTKPPFFKSRDRGKETELFFEIGVSPLFVPLAQADAGPNGFQFPSDVWERLSPGQYYGRLRRPVSGTEGVWRWKKR